MRRSYLRWAGRTRAGSRASVASTRRKWNSRAHARQLFRSQGILLIRLVTQMTIWFRNCLITSRFLYLFLRFLMINKFYFCYFSAALWGQFKKVSSQGHVLTSYFNTQFSKISPARCCNAFLVNIISNMNHKHLIMWLMLKCFKCRYRWREVTLVYTL